MAAVFADQDVVVTAPRRLAATALDLTVALAVSSQAYPLGWFVAFVYLAVGDRLDRGTLGSRLFRLRVVDASSPDRLSRKASFFRNLPWLTLITIHQVPVWGSWLAAFLALALVGAEGWLVLGCGVHDGLGNMMGQARVIAAPAAVTPTETQWSSS